MGLSDCECGGFIALGPTASNRCDKCGKGVFDPVEPYTFDTICPLCGGTDLAFAVSRRYSCELQGMLRPIECENCGATWKAIYRLAGYTDLKPKQ